MLNYQTYGRYRSRFSRQNRRRNDNLEQQILTLYKAWFIDLLPFNGIRPSSWSTGLLSDLLNLQKDILQENDRYIAP